MSRRSAAIAIAMGFWLMAGAPAIADGESEFLAGRSKACVNCALPAASLTKIAAGPRPTSPPYGRCESASWAIAGSLVSTMNIRSADP